MSTRRAEAIDVRASDLRKGSARFPFAGHPRGWFVVALSEEIPPAEVVRLRFFGRDLIAYRGESGTAYVADAYCPHLGAHLGHGGAIEGESIRCPFHRWRFEGGGQCVEIPYSDKIPQDAKLVSWPVRELNGVVAVFHDPAGGAPWELAELDEEGWTERRTVVWKGLRTHVQEVFENTVDTAHIGPIHDGRGAALVGKPVFDRETMTIDIEFQAPGAVVGMPDQLNDVHLNVTLLGLGWVTVQTHVRNVGIRARQRIHVTPVDDESVDIRAVVQVRATDDPEFTAELSEIFYRAYVEDFAKDFPIWENKRYLSRPQLAKGDGPVMAYRKWASHFSEPRAEVGASAPAAEASGQTGAGWLQPLQESIAGSARWLVSAARERLRPIARTQTPAASPAAASPAAASRAAAPQGVAPTAAVASRRAAAGPTPTLRVESAREYFETLEKRFVPAAAAGVDAVFQWELGGDDVFHAQVRDGGLRVARGAHDRPTVALVITAADYVRVVNGELDGTKAFTTGGGRVRGSITAAMKMRSLFPA